MVALINLIVRLADWELEKWNFYVRELVIHIKIPVKYR